MASSFNAVPEPQSTGDYAVMSCRLNPGIYMHADTSSLIFHSTGWTACLHLKKKKNVGYCVRQDNNRIMHGPGFTTFDYLTLSFKKKKRSAFAAFYQFHSCTCNFLFCPLVYFLSVLTFLSHHLFPYFLALLCFPHPLCISPVLCQVRLFEVWVSDSWSRACWVGRCFFSPCPLVSCLLCRVTGVTRSRHSLWKLVFDVAVSLKRTSTTASSVRSAFKLHTVNRQPFLLLSQHHITLCQQCKTSRFSACNMARIRFAVTIYWKAISTFSFNFF